MLTKLQFQTLFGFKPKRRLSASKSGKKVAKKSTSKTGKKVAKKSNKVGTRMIKGVKRTIYKGSKGGKFYKKSNGRKVYFGPAMALVKSLGVKGAVKVMSAKAIEGAGYTLGYKAANVGVSMLKKAIKKNKKSVAMGTKKLVAGKQRTVYKTSTGAKYYKSTKGTKVYFGGKKKRYKSRGRRPSVTAARRRSKKSGGSKYAIKNHRHRQPKARRHTHPKPKLSKHTHDYAAMDHSHAVVEPEFVDVAPDMVDPDMMDPVMAEFGKKRRRRTNRFGNHGSYDLSSMMGPSRVMFASSMPRGL